MTRFSGVDRSSGHHDQRVDRNAGQDDDGTACGR